MLYGTKFENDKVVVEAGNKEELEAKGMEVFESENEARLRGENIEYRTLRREFNAMSLAELDSDRARELERRIWGKHENFDDCDYVPGAIIAGRKKRYIEKMKSIN